MAATTIYLHPNNSGALFYEKDLNTDGTVVDKHYITADGQVVAQIRQVGNTQTVLYLHRDQLGSTTTITDADGNVIERLAYEPFGKRRFPEGRPDDAGEIVGIHTDRGFTNHEHLEELGLIHMNGRIYDPAIGRFMSADPYIQAPENLQSYNRYAYVFNNPLILTDPTGYFSLRNVFKVVAIAVASYYTAGWVSSTYYGAAVGSAATAAAATGASLTVAQLTTMWATAQIVGGAVGGFAGSMLASKGNFNAGFKGAVIGGLFGAAGGAGESSSYARYAAHAGAGCASGELQGGGCVRGAASAVVGKYVSNQTARWDDVSRGVAATVAGGTVSVIGGGKFDNGAATAAFGYMFNAMAEKWRQLGMQLGTGVGVVAATSCTVSTAGVCAAGAPGLIVGGAAVGAAVGGTAGAVYDSIYENSLNEDEVLYPNNPDNSDFTNINGGKGAKINPSDGSVWERDTAQHGSREGDGSQWKRWPDKRSWEKRDKPNSIWPDGRIRK